MDYWIDGLPNVAEQFSADVLLAGLVARHQSFGCGQHGDTESTAHARDIRRAHVPAQPRGADPAQTFDHARLALIFELHLDRSRQFSLDREVIDVTLALENSGNVFFDLGVGNL